MYYQWCLSSLRKPDCCGDCSIALCLSWDFGRLPCDCEAVAEMMTGVRSRLGFALAVAAVAEPAACAEWHRNQQEEED